MVLIAVRTVCNLTLIQFLFDYMIIFILFRHKKLNECPLEMLIF